MLRLLFIRAIWTLGHAALRQRPFNDPWVDAAPSPSAIDPGALGLVGDPATHISAVETLPGPTPVPSPEPSPTPTPSSTPTPGPGPGPGPTPSELILPYLLSDG